MSRPPRIEDLLREAAPRVLGALVRRFGDFADSEDAVQEALLEAATQWPARGPPESPVGWLIHVASRRISNRREPDEQHSRAALPADTGGPPQSQAEVALTFWSSDSAMREAQ